MARFENKTPGYYPNYPPIWAKAHWLPPLVFTEWKRWEERGSLKGLEKAGIYLIREGDLKEDPSNAYDEKIIYIGITERTLEERLNEFETAANDGVSNHAGGRTFFKKNKTLGNISVAIMPIAGVCQQTQFILYVERLLILNWALRHGGIPECNKQ